jgi:hypothetical protein
MEIEDDDDDDDEKTKDSSYGELEHIFNKPPLYQVWKTSMQKLGDKIFPSDK